MRLRGAVRCLQHTTAMPEASGSAHTPYSQPPAHLRVCSTAPLVSITSGGYVQVGYLLGLGDRHPSNLMLDRYSGKLLHIDFGDCFEASMHREKFPEKVPFRLTRMMVKGARMPSKPST